MMIWADTMFHFVVLSSIPGWGTAYILPEYKTGRL